MSEENIRNNIEKAKKDIEAAVAQEVEGDTTSQGLNPQDNVDAVQDAFDATMYRAKKKKAKLRKKRRIQAAILVVVLLAGVAGFRYYQVKKAAAEAEADTTVEIVVNEGETLVYAQIDEIYGNEMTYTVLVEAEEQSSESGRPSRDSDTEGTSSEEGQTPFGDGEMPSGGPGGDGEMPSGGPGGDGEMPSGAPGGDGTMPSSDSTQTGSTSDSSATFVSNTEGNSRISVISSDGETEGTVYNTTYAAASEGTVTTVAMMGGPGGGGPGGNFSGGGPGEGGMGGMDLFGSSSSQSSNTVTIGEVTYEPGEEQHTVQIPVGTVVTTKLGTETTFSRLAAGNNIAIVMDGEEIVRIYIVG